MSNRDRFSKKLIEAGEFWATPVQYNNQEIAQLEQLGLSPERPPDFGIFEENFVAFQIFTQASWHRSAMTGHLESLNISDLKAQLDLEEVDDRKSVYKKIKLIENGALRQQLKNEKNRKT